MPKLSTLQWLLTLLFLAFYGFAVFAVTRDYYMRHPLRPVAANPGPAAPGLPPGHPAPGASTAAVSTPQRSVLGAVDTVPAAITESNPDLLRQQADGLFGERRYREVVPVYRRILELVPDDVETQNDLGLALYYAGDATGALETLRQGAAAAPKFQRIWLTLGFVSLQSGDRPKAREALERARDLGADNSMGQEAIRLLAMAKD